MKDQIPFKNSITRSIKDHLYSKNLKLIKDQISFKNVIVIQDQLAFINP